jgi:hypothetical protein
MILSIRSEDAGAIDGPIGRTAAATAGSLTRRHDEGPTHLTTEAPVHQHSMSPHKAHAMTHREHMKSEGLSRNPNDCVKYGCVGNN